MSWAGGEPHLVEVADGVFAYVQPDGTWWINNTGLILGDGQAVSVDACATEARTRAYLEAIRTVTPDPVRKLINTHHHGDHTFGNWLFDEAVVIGHDGVRDGIRDWGAPRSAPFWSDVEWGVFEPAPPTITFDTALTVWAGDVRCEVRHVGASAHTSNDSVVWIEDKGVLFAGDLLFNGGTPFTVQGSVAGSLDVIERVLRPLPAEIIVCGHGPVGGPELLDDVSGYLRWVQSLAAAGRAAGLTPLEVARESDLGRYAEWSDPERIVGNLHRAYAELDGGAAAPLDAAAALADMVAFNGGRPLTCHA